MGLENVFFRARPIVESLARSTILSSTTFFSNNRKVQRARPFGGLEQASAISLASFSPSKIRAIAGVARCLRLKTASKPSSNSCFRTPVNHRCAGLQRLDDPVVTPAFTGFGNVGLQRYPRLQQALRRALALSYQRFEMLAFLAAQPHNILLYRSILRSMILSIACLATESNHKIYMLAN